MESCSHRPSSLGTRVTPGNTVQLVALQQPRPVAGTDFPSARNRLVLFIDCFRAFVPP